MAVKSFSVDVVLSRTSIASCWASATAVVAIFKNTESVLVKFVKVIAGVSSLVRLSQSAIPLSEVDFRSTTGVPGSV